MEKVDWNNSSNPILGLGIGLSPHGESGLKWCKGRIKRCRRSRSPHGESGLKWTVRRWNMESIEVFLRMEKVDWNIYDAVNTLGYESLSPHGESGLKCSCSLNDSTSDTSFSAWRKWIEMYWALYQAWVSVVFLRMEKVDWNTLFAPPQAISLSLSPHGESGLK